MHPAITHPRVRDWLEIREPLERQLAPLGRAAMARLGLRRGQRVIDIGCGIGTTPAALSQLVGAGGEVLGVDVLADAVAVLRAECEAPGVSFACADAGSFAFAPGSFDAAFSRFGVMFFADPVAAFANIRRALRPDGRLGFVCWRGLAENELDLLPLNAAGLPAAITAAAHSAGHFAFADPAHVRDVLTRAGFADVEIDAHDEQVGCGDLAATVAVCTRVGSLGAILRERPDLRERAAAALERMLRPLDGPEGPLLRAGTWVVLARA